MVFFSEFAACSRVREPVPILNLEQGKLVALGKVENAAQVRIPRAWISRILNMYRKIAIHAKCIPIDSNIAVIEGSLGVSLEYKQV